MPKFSGLFDSFDNLEKINVENVASFLKNPPQLIPLENYLANRILYPQTLPLTEQDLNIDLAILREALKLTISPSESTFLGENPFFNKTLRKIMIPRRFLNFIPSLAKLTWAFVDVLPFDRTKNDYFEQLWVIELTDDTNETVGSLLLPQFDSGLSTMSVNLLGKSFQVKPGTLLVIPCPKDRCEISYKFDKGKILGKAENALEISGGKLGLMIDGRKR